MSKKLSFLFAGVVASLAFVLTLAGAVQGCGSSGGGTNFQSLCNQACDKIAACTADAGIPSDPATCKSSCTTQASQHCSNESAIVSKVQECLNMQDCTAAEACAQTIPSCQTTSGTGGTTGTGGSGTGRGGNTGTGGTGTGGTSGGGWSCTTAAQGCSCVQAAGGTATSCTGSFSCCFTATIGGQTTCNCTNNTQGLSCAMVAQAASGSVVSSCPQ